eukprot:CAMPEP_0117444062 /NCGR_PEP_ID=MMETSP0759-20121206/5035_1 /TAXON_ID=63605 /ORGANISM="Percolomonas cosmopolitus, Strain WS" /LENGTH=338 /DNA_ID=CAMNT_0005236093 /DNA_START=35 /DNA_END=1047 /DNA_ORIENTATION=-
MSSASESSSPESTSPPDISNDAKDSDFQHSTDAVAPPSAQTPSISSHNDRKILEESSPSEKPNNVNKSETMERNDNRGTEENEENDEVSEKVRVHEQEEKALNVAKGGKNSTSDNQGEIKSAEQERRATHGTQQQSTPITSTPAKKHRLISSGHQSISSTKIGSGMLPFTASSSSGGPTSSIYATMTGNSGSSSSSGTSDASSASTFRSKDIFICLLCLVALLFVLYTQSNVSLVPFMAVGYSHGSGHTTGVGNNGESHASEATSLHTTQEFLSPSHFVTHPSSPYACIHDSQKLILVHKKFLQMWRNNVLRTHGHRASGRSTQEEELQRRTGQSFGG